jgi:hypothetical protein
MPLTRDNDRWGIEAFSSKAKRRSPVRAGQRPGPGGRQAARLPPRAALTLQPTPGGRISFSPSTSER